MDKIKFLKRNARAQFPVKEKQAIYLGVDGQLVSNVKLLVDGEVFPYAAYDLQQWDFSTPGNPDIQWTYGMRFQSDRLTNGTHTLQVVTTLRLSEARNEKAPYITMTSPAISVGVNNPIIFEPWQSLMVGTNHTFNARTTIYPADWEIDVWDAYVSRAASSSRKTGGLKTDQGFCS